MDDSLGYYDKRADEFFARTMPIDMSESYSKFLPLLSSKAKILDAGCGTGRDAKYFQDLGHEVVAFDGSSEMVRMASKLLGKPALQLNFRDLNFDREFDAVWASASLLHVPYEELRGVLQKIHHSLKESGTFFASFKYGDSLRLIDGRSFYDMNEELILPYLTGLFEGVELWQTCDPKMVAPSASQNWLRVVCRKATNF